ncbi:MAG TPA: Gmad2 immunoglobulin-like domain-containing protein [Dehalococcoidia bacterium]|nr:Gmad2 immunoglobulin-like domain-containing protein [Dehalococcoidia bacterium]
MFRLLLIASILAVAGFAVVPTRGRGVEATQPCPANPSPPDAADPSMILDEPMMGDTVTSPAHISGLARVFEANVRITIYSASGMVLEDTFTTAAEAGPALAPFAADVAFGVLSEQAGCVRVWEESAADGSPRNVVQVEVNLSPGTTAEPTPTATAAPVALPDTGNAGLAEAGSIAPSVVALATMLVFGLTLLLRRKDA